MSIPPVVVPQELVIMLPSTGEFVLCMLFISTC
jgi:hypothetical protein